jgi:hypothetical protein
MLVQQAAGWAMAGGVQQCCTKFSTKGEKKKIGATDRTPRETLE